MHCRPTPSPLWSARRARTVGAGAKVADHLIAADFVGSARSVALAASDGLGHDRRVPVRPGRGSRRHPIESYDDGAYVGYIQSFNGGGTASRIVELVANLRLGSAWSPSLAAAGGRVDSWVADLRLL